ncbi:DUF2183 domain-containing protein [Membranicola marinus]|uniref:DUF2183 domain-containing protein n=1 Tax=Membranihabitans marinus TaxID=1227546 RepID=A0A953HN89_9BACT|nr:phosphatase domain-containing protein [Membranihabitans marinus]MBY5957653.1 DUF2183 domain-containing protein [Membranihabitans marinus]
MWKNIKQLSQLIGKFTNRVVIGDPLLIHAYRSYGNEKEIVVRGRVIENEGITVQKEDGFWKNLVNNIRRFETDELRSIPIHLHFQGQTYEMISDREGYFYFRIPRHDFSSDSIVHWDQAEISLPEHRYKSDRLIRKKVDIMWPGSSSRYGIISDIDDTILMSHVGSWLKLQMIYVTLFQNVYQRKPFDGMSEALAFLAQDAKGQHVNPTFYVSNSPWSLYEVLEEFLQIHEMPVGPISLRDYGAFFGQQLEDFRQHKSNTIEHLLEFYPDLPFILIGDATEKDADIYLEKYSKYPDRILAIFIREGRKKEQNLRVRELFATYEDQPFYLVKHSRDMMNFSRQLQSSEKH